MQNPLLSIIVILPLVINQCSQNSSNPVSTAEDAKSVTISIATMEGFDTIAKNAVVRVTGNDMSQIYTSLTITHNSITGTVKNIAFGKDRFFEVFVYNDENIPLYYGSAYADIQPVQITYVPITLQEVDGGIAVINGTVENNSTPDSTTIINFYLLNIEKCTVLTDQNVVEITINSAAQATNGALLEYKWALYDHSQHYLDTDWEEKDTSQTIQVPLNFFFKGNIQARCLENPNVASRAGFNLEIKDGKIINFESSVAATDHDVKVIK
jgi:hypothetical protein